MKYSAIDVWEHEPEINAELLDLVTFATAHIAGYSRRGKERGTEIAVRNIAKRFSIDELAQWSIKSEHPKPMDLTWEKIAYSMPQFFDIEGQTTYLKTNKSKFEDIRGSYLYREEYF